MGFESLLILEKKQGWASIYDYHKTNLSITVLGMHKMPILSVAKIYVK